MDRRDIINVELKLYRITPVAKPRMTHRDRGKVSRIVGTRPCVAKYYAFKDEIRSQRVVLPECGAGITFILPMPKSWSVKKKRANYLNPHRQKPDLNNLIKALEDALFQDDSHIWHYKYLQKIWGYQGAIEIRIEEK